MEDRNNITIYINRIRASEDQKRVADAMHRTADAEFEYCSYEIRRINKENMENNTEEYGNPGTTDFRDYLKDGQKLRHKCYASNSVWTGYFCHRLNAIINDDYRNRYLSPSGFGGHHYKIMRPNVMKNTQGTVEVQAELENGTWVILDILIKESKRRI